jgi:ribosomal protein L37E
VTARCIGYKYKTFRKNCSFCGVSFAARTRKYLVNYSNKYMTDVLCSKECRDKSIMIDQKLQELMDEIR